MNITNTRIDSRDGTWHIQELDPPFEYFRCYTCGNDSCNDCGQIFKSKPLHIVWDEDVCQECQDAHVKALEAEANGPDDIYWGP